MQRAGARTGIVGGGVIAEGVNSDDLERRIAERFEQLYRARLVQRMLLIWAYPGNLVVAAASVAYYQFFAPPEPWAWVACVLVPAASLVLSARLVYRQHFKVRSVDSELRALQRAHREQTLDGLGVGDLLASHKRYRAELPDVIDEYRTEARRHYRRNNVLQCIVISGSIGTSAVAAASVSIADVRWVAVVLSLVVAISAAFAGHAKYRERSVGLQQTADALEREYHSVELRVGRYRRFEDEWSAYAEFAHEVELLRNDQAKRQQQLGQAANAQSADLSLR